MTSSVNSLGSNEKDWHRDTASVGLEYTARREADEELAAIEREIAGELEEEEAGGSGVERRGLRVEMLEVGRAGSSEGPSWQSLVGEATLRRGLRMAFSMWATEAKMGGARRRREGKRRGEGPRFSVHTAERGSVQVNAVGAGRGAGCC